MGLKIISQCKSIVKGLQVLVVVIIYVFRNLKVCLIDERINYNTESNHNSTQKVIMVLKQEHNSVEAV